jgi:antagonist of KipI
VAALTILRPGLFTTVQDLGRWGFQSRGVPVSGALDWYSHRAANHLVGNDPDMATLEVTLVGPHMRFDGGALFAVTGAEFRLTLDDVPVEMNRMLEARPGSILRFGERLTGARAYLAAAGGIDVPKVLGSRSTHVLTRMGGYEGRALRAGDILPAGTARDVRAVTAPWGTLTRKAQRGRLRVIAADERLAVKVVSQRFRVSTQSDRMGYRLEDGFISAAPGGELISSAVPTGAIQVPPTGKPILLMNDHATTGGYAVAAALITADLPVAGQLAPGDWVEFEACSIEFANDELHRLEAALERA